MNSVILSSSSSSSQQLNENKRKNTKKTISTTTRKSPVVVVEAPTVNPITKNSSYTDFLNKHKCTKDSNVEKTHTRIPDKSISEFHGSAYSIPDDEYQTFIELYFKEVVSKNIYDTIVEIQLPDDGPLLVDIDLHFEKTRTERFYDFVHIDELIDYYLECFLEMYQFNEEDTSFKVFVLEKDNMNFNTDKNYIKDGIHIIFGFQVNKIANSIITKKVKTKIKDELWSDFPLKDNDWSNVIDDAITTGSSGWQLLNSKKPDHEAYKLTHVFEITYQEPALIKNEIDKSPYLKNSSKFIEMTARYKEYPSYFYKSSFIPIFEEQKQKQEKKVKKTSVSNDNDDDDDESSNSYSITDILNIQSSSELDLYVEKFLKNINNEKEFIFKEINGYIMTLPVSYYGKSSYSKWIRVCWALRHISNKLFIVFVKFSSQTEDFLYPTSIQELYDEYWKKADTSKEKTLTIRSIIYWSKTEAPEKYKKVKEESLNYYIDLTLGIIDNYSDSCTNADKFMSKCSDFDIARVVYHYFKDEFVCVNINKNIWYRFENHRWVENDSGTTLRKSMSTDIFKFYSNRMNDVYFKEYAEETAKEEQNEKKVKSLSCKMTRCSDIMLRLKTTTDKKNIMSESRDLFYDSTFYNKLDSNKYLLCFKNGIYDFKEKVFRDGYPEDYISKTTNINYLDYDTAMQKTQIVDEINDFMQKLFPEKELLQYMWDHLSSTLLGETKNHTFNMYIGCGQNGKSVLVNFMEKVLGQYKGDVPLSLITDKRGKIGGVSPEIVELKGIRYAVMQEPSKGDKINEGLMKSITGSDPMMGRAPYQVQTVHYDPQFKLVVCSNELMEVVSQDHGTWRRIRVVEYKSLFVENPVQNNPDKPYQFKLDKDIKDKFNSWKEVFASMLVKRVNETGGDVNDCEQVLKASNEYKNSQNYYAEFINEKIIKIEGSLLEKKQFNIAFRNWFYDNKGRRATSNDEKDAGKYMSEQYTYDTAKNVWKGASIKETAFTYPDNQENLEVDDDIDLP
jgi:P4 family phage/plasmid primase-like protien